MNSANPIQIPETVESSEDLSPGLRGSIFLHLFVLLFALIQGFVFPDKPVPYIPSLKVDLVGLPDILKKNTNSIYKQQFKKEIAEVLKKAETHKTEPHKAELHKNEMTLSSQTSTLKSQIKNREKKNQHALDRIKALNKIQESSNEELLPHPHTKLLKGNKISQGASLSKDAKENSEANYLDLVKDQIQTHWVLSPWLDRQKLSAQIQLYITAEGKLRQIKFVKSSGNPQFDEAIQQILSQSEPFPTPPENVQNELLTHGILVGFPL